MGCWWPVCVGFHCLSSSLCPVAVQKCSFIFTQRRAEMPGVLVQLVCFCFSTKSIFLKESARFSWLWVCGTLPHIQSVLFVAWASKIGRERKTVTEETSTPSLALKYAKVLSARNCFYERIAIKSVTTVSHHIYNLLVEMNSLDS